MAIHDKLINLVLNEVPLTRTNLVENGITSHHINKLINENVLKRVSRGIYELVSYNYVYQYGYCMLKEKKFDKAISCFQLSIKYNINVLASYYNLFHTYINQNDYESALNILDNLKLEINERKYLLYLLSNLTNLPEKYMKEIKYLYFDDIRSISSSNDYLENKIRGLCLHGNYNAALKLQNTKMKDRLSLSREDYIHQTLIYKLYKNKKELDSTIFTLVQEEKYDELLILLNCQYHLSKMEIYVKKLVELLININETKKIPKVRAVKCDNVFDAIDRNNFSLAYSLNKEYNEKRGNNNNSFSILLNKVSDLIRKINQPILPKKELTLSYQKEINNENFEEIEMYLNRIYKFLLRKKGFMILDTYEDEFTQDMLALLSLYPYLNATLIKFDNENHILIRYNAKNLSEDESKRFILYASYALEYKDCETCINMANEALQTEFPDYEIYSILGYAYIIKGDSKKAKECFIAATCISRNNYMQDYSDIILKLGGSYAKPIDFSL